jgi:hypothetical protein
VAGAVMGGAVHTVVAPIERVKLLLQTQDGNAALLGRGRRFRGFADCVARTVRDEGVLSLWRGNGTGVIRYYPSVALNFSLKVPFPSLPEPANPPPSFVCSLSFHCSRALQARTLVCLRCCRRTSDQMQSCDYFVLGSWFHSLFHPCAWRIYDKLVRSMEK